MQTIAQSLAYAQALGLERLDAQLLCLHALGKSAQQRAWLVAHNGDAIDAATQAVLEAYFVRRLAAEPLAYITGQQEFYGLGLRVDARVLVPRADTETLVDWALEVLQGLGCTGARVMDLGTGSGAIALALKHARAQLDVHAVDMSGDALAVAQANAQSLGLEVAFAQGAWLTGVRTQFHVIVSNPPYIAQGDAHLAALRHEPLSALTSGSDGLDAIRSIIAQAGAHLYPGGWLLLEHGYDQASAVRALLHSAGLQHVQSRRDLAGIERCSGAQAEMSR